MRKILVIIIFLTAVSNGAYAFDCKKAATKSEKVICSSKSLIKADTEMNKVYQEVYNNYSDTERKALKKAQLGWLKERDDMVSGAESLLKVIEARKDFLEIWKNPEVMVREKNYLIKRVHNKEGNIDISYPELTGLADISVMSFINADILAAKMSSCLWGGDIFDTAEVMLFNSYLFNYKVGGGGFCNRAAHSYSNGYGVVYDVRDSRKPIELEEVLYSEDGNQSPDLVKLMKDELKKNPPEADCIDSYSDERLDNNMYFSFYFDKSENLVLIPSLAHVENACTQDFVFSRADLEKAQLLRHGNFGF